MLYYIIGILVGLLLGSAISTFIFNSRIKKLVAVYSSDHNHLAETMNDCERKLAEAGIKLNELKNRTPDISKIRPDRCSCGRPVKKGNDLCTYCEDDLLWNPYKIRARGFVWLAGLDNIPPYRVDKVDRKYRRIYVRSGKSVIPILYSQITKYSKKAKES